MHYLADLRPGPWGLQCVVVSCSANRLAASTRTPSIGSRVFEGQPWASTLHLDLVSFGSQALGYRSFILVAISLVIPCADGRYALLSSMSFGAGWWAVARLNTRLGLPSGISRAFCPERSVSLTSVKGRTVMPWFFVHLPSSHSYERAD